MRPSGSFSIRMIDGRGADRVEVGLARVLDLGVPLGDQHDHPVLGQGLVDGANGALPGPPTAGR